MEIIIYYSIPQNLPQFDPARTLKNVIKCELKKLE